jgi:hypothetical protein
MQIDISKQEAWKIIEAIDCYLKDYAVSGAVGKIFVKLNEKLSKIVKEPA